VQRYEVGPCLSVWGGGCNDLENHKGKEVKEELGVIHAGWDVLI
jgi:hypothetical protein